MFRQASRRVVFAQNLCVQNARPGNRSLVSTVLLNRSWETETVVTLRQELQKRGLSAKGNKATLITRIRDFDVQQTTSPTDSAPSGPLPAQTRNASTASAPSQTSASPPPPPQATPAPSSAPQSSTSYPIDVLDIKLPDLSVRPAEPPVQIPLSFDIHELTDASALSTDAAPTYKELPKILLVGGESTHTTASNMVSAADIPLEAAKPRSDAGAPAPTGVRGLAYDMLDDFGLPHTISWPQESRQATVLVADAQNETVGIEKDAISPKTRELTKEESAGALWLVGSLAAAWLVAGIFAPRPAKAETDGKTGESH